MREKGQKDWNRSLIREGGEEDDSGMKEIKITYESHMENYQLTWK